MLPNKPDPNLDNSKDELRRLLKEALKKKRPRWLRFALAIFLAVAALAALLAWLLFPDGELPAMTVVAFDDLAPKGTEVTLHGRLEAAADAHAALAGKEMMFVDGQVLLVPGRQATEVAARTGPHGEVSCPWKFPTETVQGNFILRRIGDKFRPGMEDRGRIFLIPGGTPLCLVQINDTLTHANDQAWQKENIQDIVPEPRAAEALQEARRQGYEIVYLALADRPTLYQKVRGWVRQRSAEGAAPIPAGAVLSRLTLPAADQDTRPWQKTAARLEAEFVLPRVEQGKHRAIAGTIEVAQQFHAAGFRTIYLGAGEDLPTGVQRAPGWEEVRRFFEK